jgi:hypothetical protein
LYVRYCRSRTIICLTLLIWGLFSSDGASATDAASSPAAAQSAPAQANLPASAGACGKTVEDKLAAAQAALQSNGAPSRAAFVCLMEATKVLNDRLQSCEQARPNGGLRVQMLDVPINPSH